MRNLTSPTIVSGVWHMRSKVADRALGRILDRHHRIIGLAGLGCAKHFIDRRARLGLDQVPEMLAHRGMAEGARRAEVGDSQLLLERETR
jgi:hypothetical protein